MLETALLPQTALEARQPKEKKKDLAEQVMDVVDQRVKAETDMEKVIDGIIPLKSLYDPKDIPREIVVDGEPVPVKRVSKLEQAIKNVFQKLARLNISKAEYSSDRRKINVSPLLDRQQTLQALAKMDFSQVSGLSFAHETLHAYQDGTGIISPEDTLTQARDIMKADADPTWVESIGLVDRPRDLAILSETQAYLLEYMLGTEMSPAEVQQTQKFFQELAGKLEPSESGEPIKIEGATIGNIPLEKFGPDGFASMYDLITENVRTYLPDKEEQQEEHLERVRAACIQLMRLVEAGMGHKQIATLIKQNNAAFANNTAWDENAKGYRFLNEALQQTGFQSELDDQTMIQKLDLERKIRLTKVSTIAKEEMAKANLT